MDEDGEGGEVRPEARPVQKMAGPRKPRETEVRQHEITHLPCRSCCWACVQGRGKRKPHRETAE